MQTPTVYWGPGFGNTITFPYPLSLALAHSEPRQGHKSARAEGSGSEDGMLVGHDYFLEGELVFIPLELWDGPAGVKMWLYDASQGMPFQWLPYPTANIYTCYMEDPIADATFEANKDRHIVIKMRTVDAVPFVEY